MTSIEVQNNPEEWHWMWSELALHALNSGDTQCIHPDTGEIWQYMGTSDDFHTFRHRNHPVTGKREYIHIPLRK